MYIAKLKTIRGFGQMKNYFKLLESRSIEETQKLGNETADKMKAIIKSKKVRPQAGEPTTLEDAIDVEHFNKGNEVGWGVGNITRLDSDAIYWRAVNYGSSHMVGKQMPMGVFDPGMAMPDAGSFRAGRFKKGLNKGGQMYAPVVTNPIPPMNYIQKTINFVNRQIVNLQARLRRR